MKSQFPGYFSLSSLRIKNLWDKGLFVFDANILLGLYRYSDSTRKEFFATLENIKNRCWLPHQAVKEYFDNRLSVIGKQEEAYIEIIKAMDDIESRFNTAHQHPFLSQGVLKNLCKSFELARDELNKSRTFHTDRINTDDVLNNIEKIFGNRVGLPYPEKDLADILKEGEDRYNRNIPPGFRDGKKDDPSDPNRKYGDLILWKQILDKVKVEKLGVVFVCDDRKDDWWLQFKGKTLGARPELIKEFIQVSGTDFHIYSSDRFLKYAGEHFNRAVSEAAVSEMRELKRFDDEKRNQLLEFQARSFELEAQVAMLEASRTEILTQIQAIEIEKSVADRNRQLLARKVHSEDPASLSASDFNRLEEYADRAAETERRIYSLRERSMILENEIKKIQQWEEKSRIQYRDGKFLRDF